MTKRRFPVDGIVNVKTGDPATKAIWIISRVKDDQTRNDAWHAHWHEMETMPSWKIPHWSEFAVDVGGWKTGREFQNWYTFNICCCYLWLERMTRGMYPVDDIQHLLSSPERGQTDQVFDGVQSPYVIRSKERLGAIMQRYFKPVSDFDRAPDRVVYPAWGLQAMLDLIDERFKGQSDIWKRNMKYQHQRRAINRAQFLVSLTDYFHLRATAKSLSRLGPSLEI